MRPVSSGTGSLVWFSSREKVAEVVAASEGDNRCRLEHVVTTMG